MTRAQKLAMLEAQGGCCAVCKSTDPGGKGWQTDHDRSCCPTLTTCGECIRGILCTRCNRAMGMFEDDPALLMSAAEYLSAITF